MNKERLSDLRKSALFKAFVRCRLPALPLFSIFGVLLLILGILMASSHPLGFLALIAVLLLIIVFVVYNAIDLYFSLSSLAELDDKEFSLLQNTVKEGRLKRNIIGSYTDHGLLTGISFIPYNDIVKLKYTSTKVLPFISFDGLDLDYIPPMVKITRERMIFGKRVRLAFRYYLPSGENAASALDRFTDEILARSDNKILVDNDYVFKNI